MSLGFVERSTCQVCGSSGPAELLSVPFTDARIFDFIGAYYGDRISHSDLEGHSYQISRCTRCGFIWQRWVLDEPGMEFLYSVAIDADESASKRSAPPFSSYLRWINEAIDLGGLFPGRSPVDVCVLDYGVGWGYWARAAAGLGYSVIGLDLAQTRLTAVESAGIKTVGSSTEIESHTIDVLRAAQVIEHIPDLATVRDEFLRLLAPGGVLVVAVPDGNDIERHPRSPKWRVRNDALHPLEHINCFTNETLTRFAQEAGMKPIFPRLVGTRSQRLEQFPRYLVNRWRNRGGTRLYFKAP